MSLRRWRCRCGGGGVVEVVDLFVGDQMDLDKILSSSPPQKRRQTAHPSLRHFVISKKHNPSELEVAEMMLVLSNTHPTAAEPAASPFAAAPVAPPAPPPPGAKSGSGYGGGGAGIKSEGSRQFQGDYRRFRQSQSFSVSTPSSNGMPNLGTGSAEEKKGRRAGTRRLAASPSGKPCPNCGASSSTLWRTCKMQSGSSYLCNACGLRYKKGKYCPLCFRVYYDVDTNQLQWKQCQNCLNWTHKQCLQQQGLGSTSAYICVNCKRDSDEANQNIRNPVL